jgi:hypothetical protein
MARQTRDWLSNKEYQKKKLWYKKVQAIVEAREGEEEKQSVEAEAKWRESQREQGILPHKPSLGNYILGTGDRTKWNPTGQLGAIPYLVGIVVVGVLYKLSFGILPLVLLLLFACGVGIKRWIERLKK